MSHKELKLNLARLFGVGAASILLGLVGRQIALKMHRSHTRKLTEHKLDSALEQSMDCSDPVAQY